MEALPVICRLAIESAPDLAAIDSECNTPPWSEGLFRSEFAHSHSFTLGARCDGALAGFVVCHVVGDEAHILSLGVRRAFRRRGLALALLHEALAEMHRTAVRWVTLEVREGNLAARALYQRLGFADVGRRQKYYTDNQEDALVLQLSLPQYMYEQRRI